MLYKVIHREELVDEFYFDADDEKQALDQFNAAVISGNIDLSDMEVAMTSDEVVECNN